MKKLIVITLTVKFLIVGCESEVQTVALEDFGLSKSALKMCGLEKTGIVFESGYGGKPQIYAYTPDADAVLRLTKKGNNYGPSFSAINQKVVFTSTRDKNAEIYSMNIDGKDKRNITNHPSDDVFGEYSSDGSKLVFQSNRNMNLDFSKPADFKLYNLSDADGVSLINERSLNTSLPVSWSDDDNGLYYSRVIEERNIIKYLDLKGGKEKEVYKRTGNINLGGPFQLNGKLYFYTSKKDLFTIESIELDNPSLNSEVLYTSDKLRAWITDIINEDGSLLITAQNENYYNNVYCYNNKKEMILLIGGNFHSLNAKRIGGAE